MTDERLHNIRGCLAAGIAAASVSVSAMAQDTDASEAEAAAEAEVLDPAAAIAAARRSGRVVTGTFSMEPAGEPDDEPAAMTAPSSAIELDDQPDLNIRMFSAARESADRARLTRNSDVAARRQMEADAVDVSMTLGNRGGVMSPQWNLDVSWHPSAPSGVREIEYWPPGDENSRISVQSDTDFTAHLHGAGRGGGPGMAVFWRFRDWGASDWGPVQFDRALAMIYWPETNAQIEMSLSWEAVPGADHYGLRFGRNGAISQYVAARVPDPGIRLTFEPTAVGSYVWEVTAYDAQNSAMRNIPHYTDSGGRVLARNAAGSVTNAPREFVVRLGPLNLVDLQASWAATPGAQSYNVSISLSDDFTLPANADALSSDVIIMRSRWPATELTLRDMPRDHIFHVRVEPVMADGALGSANVFTVSTASGGSRG